MGKRSRRTRKKKGKYLMVDKSGKLIRGKKDIINTQKRIQASFMAFVLAIRPLPLETLEKALEGKYIDIVESDGDSTQTKTLFLSENRRLALRNVVEEKRKQLEEEKNGESSSLRNSKRGTT